MNIFAIFGDLIIRMFNFVGKLILEIPNIPDKLRGINSESFKEKIDTEKIRENVSQIKNDVKIKNNSLKISKTEAAEIFIVNNKENIDKSKVQSFEINKDFTSKQKERTVFVLQLLSLGFLALSILYLFNFLSFVIYCILGVLLVGCMVYILFSKVKLMYHADFNAYRDFFLMYVAAGIILVLFGTNSNLVMAFSFDFFPSFTVLLFAVIFSIAVFLIFRIRYHRNYTYGTVIEAGKKTAYVTVDYDICSNVKPDTYIVDNSYGANEGEIVKLQVEEKLLSRSGNKPICILETINM
ncbi:MULTISPECIES: DUF2101 family protein [Methanobacterium]|uniref:DUF2101 domain-containing protein n=1 Tax=Methanobacterium bryantii TaxID=2161 RepID=A0A2A2H881_METBR|nr:MULTISPECIES: DUF2101 family protein [Methanobacterium]OEC84882.1 hypothetical protein A9507_14575 [Methanobacterium sp. A39]PAV05526.1 hypothetical protein ASJ80_09120 [Methanobacterium bryantii]